MAEEKNLVKQMRDEMNEEFTQAFIENIQTLIPKEWKPRIQEMFPKILNIVKHGLNQYKKNFAKVLGENKKIMILQNVPVKYEGSDKIEWQPHYYLISTDKLKEFRMKEGEQMDINYSINAFIEKIQTYKTIEELMVDIQSGKVFSAGLFEAQLLEEQKQIEAPK